MGRVQRKQMPTVQEKAKEIIEEKERIIASEKDSRIFFDCSTGGVPTRLRKIISLFENIT